MKKWIQYQRIMWKLNKAKRKEIEVRFLCYEIGIDFEDLTLRNINDKIKKIDNVWLKDNLIN